MSFKKSYTSLLLCIPIFFLSTQAKAGVFAEAGLHFGGDNLATVSFWGADSQSVEGGGLISGAIGYEQDISDIFLMKLSAGIKFDTVNASNGNVDFTRFPLTGMLFVKGVDLHYGVGITQHTGVELSVDGFFSSGNVEFDDATGFVMQVDYLLNERGYISLTYTSIDYQPVYSSSADVNGNSLGVLIGFRFGK